MKLYIICTNDYGFDEYDSHVVAAMNKNEAIEYISNSNCLSLPGAPDSWNILEIGTYKAGLNPGVIHSSYNAG